MSDLALPVSEALAPTDPAPAARVARLPQSQALFDRIAALDLHQSDRALGFAARLARENLWTESRARAVIEEYKRFLYLMAISDELLTPSEAVDAAWHLHLSYSRSYWDDLCKGILGGLALHHDPTEGGEAAEERYRAAYARTLTRYRHVFGFQPPADIWPDVETRFAEAGTQRIVSTQAYWVVRRPVRLLRGLAAVATLAIPLTALAIARSVPADDDVPAVIFVGFLITIFLGIPLGTFALTGKWEWWKFSNDAGGCGGCGGCGG